MADKAEAKKAVVRSKQAGVRAKKGGARAKTGASRRKVQKRVGRPSLPSVPDSSTPQAAKAWLLGTGRSQLAAGRTLRTSAKADADAFEDVAAECRERATSLKARGVAPNLVAGAGLIAKDEEASSVEAAAATPPSMQVQRTAERVLALRGALNRLLHGPRNAEARKEFGLNVPVNPNQASSVAAAARKLVSGAATAGATEAAGFVLAEDVRELTADVKAIDAEQKKAKKDRTAETTGTAERDIRTAALELFYDKYAAAVSLVVADPVARLRALQLVPRREERRGSAEEGGGTGEGKS